MKRLLFYSSSTGVAATGQIDESGNFMTLKSYGEKELMKGWTHIAAAQAHYLLYNAATGGMTTAQINEEGELIVQQNYPEGTLPKGITHIAATAKYVLFYNASNGAATIGYIGEGGNLVILQSFEEKTFPKGWTHLAATYDYLVFYDSTAGAVTTAQIDETGKLATLQNHKTLADWTHLTATQDRLFFYNAFKGTGITGRVDGTGKFIDLKSYPADTFVTAWTQIAATAQHLLFYHGATGAAATAQIAPDGRINILQNYPDGSLARGWTHINTSRLSLLTLHPLFSPVRLRLVIEAIGADWTTERGVQDSRDEIYFVLAGASGTRTTWRSLDIPNPRLSPPPPADYYPFWNGTVYSNIPLLDVLLKNEESVYLQVVIREQDNAQVQKVLEEAVGAGVGTAALLAGNTAPGKIPEGKLQGVLAAFTGTLRQDGDQTVGELGVRITNRNGSMAVEWIAGDETRIVWEDPSSALFEATGNDARYGLRVGIHRLPF